MTLEPQRLNEQAARRSYLVLCANVLIAALIWATDLTNYWHQWCSFICLFPSGTALAALYFLASSTLLAFTFWEPLLYPMEIDESTFGFPLNPALNPKVHPQLNPLLDRAKQWHRIAFGLSTLPFIAVSAVIMMA